MKYSFEIVFKKHEIKNVTLETIQSIYVSGICIMAKNNKFGGIYKSKYVDKIQGKFAKVAGSNSYPVLYPERDTIIFVIGFPKNPILDFDDYDKEYKSGFLYLQNIYSTPELIK